MLLNELSEAVQKFATVWFPPDGSSQPYWFRARDQKHRAVIHQLCSDYMKLVEAIMTEFGQNVNLLAEHLISECWSDIHMCVLGVLLDQMPRNAIAIEYRSNSSSAQYVAAFDIFTLQYISIVMTKLSLGTILDYRIVCFVSLIFRHSNKFEQARIVLRTLERQSEDTGKMGLPPLAQKFWLETDKRETSSRNSKE